ncbi:hypothetical protein [Sphingobacterium hotanense]|uniref:hypothetical protein n=1 Tax=Sphingobacterium hotanense TaxID=649196 RepID=UPI0021A7C3A0|nr:hypothetical protein [Sphingobacterium hotanense]MCT1523869.1 hypothetical protein [Sphingobacterium hotanense]
MGGNAGIRGYLIQTIICVLDALDSDSEWLEVTLEPLNESEKVDIRWVYPDKVKVCQVKSSQNIIRFNDAKKWCTDLTTNSPNINEYELIVVGHPEEKLIKSDNIDQVKISKVQSLDVDSLIDIASTKIDAYYEKHGKSKMSSKVREILVKTLTAHFGTNSITGKEISREDFDQHLLEWISAIEKQIENNPFAVLASPKLNENLPFNFRIAKKILDLIGWTNFNENVTVSIYNERTEENDQFKIDFFGDFESKLKSDTDDAISITSIHDLTYPASSKQEIQNYIYGSDKIQEDLLAKKKIPIRRNSTTEFHNILFWLTTENSEVNEDFIHHAKDNYRKDWLNDDMYYYLVDNNKAVFLISSIVTAKNYREDLTVKFLYPITEANQNPGQIGKRGTKLPAQFINTSVLPIIKESSDKISILIFCSDAFSEDSLKKLIWLTIRLTSGLGNEYLLYFPNYKETEHLNLANEAIRSFNDEILGNKIVVKRYDRIDAEALASISSTNSSSLKNETFDELQTQSDLKSKHLNEAFINILPYGDIIKPFLKTDAITANDMKIFLAKKGIFVKSADRAKLIGLMSVLLFSPKELEDFKTLIDVKDRPVNTTNEIFQIKQNESLENIFKRIRPNFDNITENLNTKLLDPPVFKPNPSNTNEYIFDVRTERKDPTSQISVNTLWGRIEIVCSKESDKLVVNRVNTVSREDKLIANRVMKSIEGEFKQADFIKEDTLKVMFKSFGNNIDRVNFLLSFTNVTSSTIFKEPEIKSIKFKFDDTEDIPEAFKDKKDKDLITYFSGRNLSGINEISEEDFKKVLLLEEIYITYKYDHFNLKNGFYSVKYNFSDALKNKPERDGVFKSEPSLYMSNQVKALTNIDGFKKELSREIERIKLEKLKQFNIIE